ncbi:hypothetical protein GCM10027085_48690 [Spirosoma aerophilum]
MPIVRKAIVTLKYPLALLTGTILSACFPKLPGPCYDCQIIETIQLTNQSLSKRSTAYTEVCDSLEAVKFINRNTLAKTTPIGIIDQQEVYSIRIRSATCAKK